MKPFIYCVATLGRILDQAVRAQDAYILGPIECCNISKWCCDAALWEIVL
jgi:hypothetical protein